ncbi:TetR family transcriptional regulator [Rhodococcus sp. SMB37]|uniref:TetR/AcrR family transcriptional regulator n=1 Tax=Rhodococcus sp. SMB37 TaxID=2512213 RepID=UPI0010DCD2E4|nr:TetR/AcrR family transcriptional regulator [Rhodococcus sp. SMB37]TCN55945.1 TetR family transcriptional regulator [Rhodococcus sp. SMB37]
MALRADKRESILTGALEVFARDGYTRAGIDVIAKESGVSTRTIYNHFGDKATLFQAVITASSDRVAAGHMSVIDNYLRKVTDLEDDLTDLGVALVWDEEYVTHFALVRQIQADIDHIPPAAVDAWRDAGPLRVRRHLADRLTNLDGLNLDDPMLAAFHLMALIGRDTSGGGRSTEEHVRAGVRVFLRGYLR